MRKRNTSPKKWVLTGMLAGSALCYVLGAGFSSRLRGAVEFVFVPLGDLGMGAATSTKANPGGISAAAEDLTLAQIQRLIDENRLLSAQLNAVAQRHVELLAQSRRMDELYDRLDFECRLIPARVVGADALGYGQTRLINAGRSAGAAAGSAVTTRELLTDRAKALPTDLAAITSTALVGRLADSAAFSARLVLVTDASFSIRAHLLRVVKAGEARKILVSGDRGAAYELLSSKNNRLLDVQAVGDGAGRLVIQHVSAQHNVRPGDRLLTRLGDPLLPAQIMIGTVHEVIEAEDKPHFVTVQVKPEADMDALREVYVVVPLGRWARTKG